PAKTADTNSAQTASQLPSTRPRSNSARTARSPNSPSYKTAPCSTTAPSPHSPPARSTGDPPHSIRLALASTSCGVTPTTTGDALATVGPRFPTIKRRTTMTDSQTDKRTLAARYLKGLNDHDPDAVDGFVTVNYINHNAFVKDGREA